MATATSFTTHRTSVAHSEHTPDNDTHITTPGERAFMIVAMSGAAFGALTGSTLAASANIPELFGLFGTLVGGVVATAAWALISPFTSRSE